ncbi:hypothetical protein ACFL27_02065 [candidate division CSSED10-310 bacterium]|uniref:Alginate export domain-containing protein n=1 Tax=candidate division CSSED10-310 bacterium TaxID=2855610 RepID=A0ABV6YRZ9_UNCC1
MTKSLDKSITTQTGPTALSRLCFSVLISLAVIGPFMLQSVFAESSASFRGYFEGRYYFFPQVGDYDYDLQHRFRPELILYWADMISITAVVNVSKNFGLSDEIETDDFKQGFSLERLYVDYSRGQYDLRIGKQAINYGSAQIWNPVNFVDANTIIDFNVEKKGVNAIRLARTISDLSNIFFVLSYPVEDDERTLSFIGTNILVGNTEIKVFLGDNRVAEEFLYGLDLKGDFVVGFWFEGAYHQNEFQDEETEDYYSYVVGVDYSFPLFETLYLAVQFHEDSSGATAVEDYDFGAYITGERTFLGRRYFSFMGMLNFSENYSCGFNALYNHHDESILLNPIMSAIIRDDWTISVGATLFSGSEPGEFNPGEDYPLADILPDYLIYFFLKYNF